MKLSTGERFFDKISVIFMSRLERQFHGKNYYKTCISYYYSLLDLMGHCLTIVEICLHKKFMTIKEELKKMEKLLLFRLFSN